MIKVFTKRSIDQTPSTGFDRKTEKKKIDGADHEGVDDNLARMLVERSDGLDTTGTMMNLMKGQPEKIQWRDANGATSRKTKSRQSS